jgi:hypothetical protein
MFQHVAGSIALFLRHTQLVSKVGHGIDNRWQYGNSCRDSLLQVFASTFPRSIETHTGDTDEGSLPNHLPTVMRGNHFIQA